MIRLRILAPSILPLLVLAGCGGSDAAHEHGEDTHEHVEEEPVEETEHDHEHEEVSLGTATIGPLTVQLAQGHGPVVAGGEGHLVVKLPYTDAGATTVRAWIGGADRTLSYVGMGEYAPSHDDYDVHATAPDPLPADVRWWVELEHPDGATHVGSIAPQLE